MLYTPVTANSSAPPVVRPASSGTASTLRWYILPKRGVYEKATKPGSRQSGPFGSSIDSGALRAGPAAKDLEQGPGQAARRNISRRPANVNSVQSQQGSLETAVPWLLLTSGCLLHSDDPTFDPHNTGPRTSFASDTGGRTTGSSRSPRRTAPGEQARRQVEDS